MRRLTASRAQFGCVVRCGSRGSYRRSRVVAERPCASVVCAGAAAPCPRVSLAVESVAGVCVVDSIRLELMLDRPEVRYAVDRRGSHIAFQQFGAGQPLLLLAGWATNLDGMWREPGLALFLRRLGAMRSVVMFDKRGVGLSDPAPDVSNAGDAVEDVLVVLDACGVTRTEVLAAAEASFVAVPLAAFHPERVAAWSWSTGRPRPSLLRAIPRGSTCPTACATRPTWPQRHSDSVSA